MIEETLKLRFHFLALVLVVAWGCKDSTPTGYFEKMPSAATGVEFANMLQHDDEFNIYTYRNFYNGGGVAIGDIDNDGLPDIYFTANMGENRLFRNLGDFKFEDITASAGVGGTRGWSTGVAMADINADGLLDIYVCNSGRAKGDDKANELFINTGDLTFREAAEEYGLADRGLSTHAAFFDYDRDGDLDVYLLNNSFRAITSFNLSENLRPIRDSIGGDKLYRNDGGRFVDVSENAGILGSVIGFGLGVTVGDVDLDGWLDIYISNDFFERDYLYINQQDGTFSEELTERVAAISAASMGADMADVNGDGYPEVFVTDMLPATDKRLKMNTTFEGWDNYINKLENGYYHQFTRNTLQSNRGDGTFAEIGRALGVEASDWSWGALFCDLDSDGDRDIYVANGIYQDLTNQDYIAFLSSEQTKKQVTQSGSVDFRMLIDMIPSEPVPNVVFEQLGPTSFVSDAERFGLADEGFSNGAAYGDLDNDGDLDLVVNNVNAEAWVYRNQLPRDDKHHSLLVDLRGSSQNPAATGARVVAYACGRLVSNEAVPTRGFQSSMDPRVFIGLGTCAAIDSLVVYWPGGEQPSRYYDLDPGRFTADISQQVPQFKSRRQAFTPKVARPPRFEEIDPNEIGLDFIHDENLYVDFDRERLIYHMISTQGPALAVGDLNNDGLEDLFFGGASEQPGVLYFQTTDGTFIKTDQPELVKDARSEDVTAVIRDFDGDGLDDLLVGSGGSEFSTVDSRLADRLYLGSETGQLERMATKDWPLNIAVTSEYATGDFDLDGDVDLFPAARMKPRNYGVPAKSYLLEGKGGSFTLTANEIFDSLGMVTCASWQNLDADPNPELILLQDWGTPIIFDYQNDGSFARVNFPASTSGWWSSLQVVDIDLDGDLDFLAGNHGINSRFRASSTEPVELYVGDFDRNGQAEQIITRYLEGKSLPISLRHDLVMQMPPLKKKYLRYDSYHGQQITDMFPEEQLASSIKFSATELRTGVFINQGGLNFKFKPLPNEAQYSPYYASLKLPSADTNKTEILLGGNLYGVKPEVGRYDASEGEIITFTEDGTIEVRKSAAIGLRLRGEIRDFQWLTTKKDSYLVVARNNQRPQIFRYLRDVDEIQ